MKALQLFKYGNLKHNLRFSEIDTPTIKSNQVLIEVHAASINPADHKILEGNFKMVYRLRMPLGVGYDVAGIIIKKGEEVNDFDVGDEVYTVLPSKTPGAVSEMVSVDSNLICLKPKNLNFHQSACIPLVGLTVIQSFKNAHIKEGDRVLIHAGSGGVGSFAIQYAKARGAYVYTTTSTNNVEWVKQLGADRVIDYKTENYLDIAIDLDIILDTLGEKYAKDAFKIIKKGGTVIGLVENVDDATGKQLGFGVFMRFLLFLMRWKVMRLAKASSSTYKYTLMQPNVNQLNELKIMIENGLIHPIIDKVYPFSESVNAILYQQKGRSKGKVVIDIKVDKQSSM